MTVRCIDVEPYAMRFASPIVTARGRFTHRQGWHVRLEDADGRSGYGDAAPWPGFASDSDMVREHLMSLSDPSAGLLGADFATLEQLDQWLTESSLCPEARYAVELAVLDLIGQREGLSVASVLAEHPAASVQSHQLVGEPGPSQAAAVKLKVGALGLDADEERIAACRAGLRPGAKLRLDASGAWSAPQARAAIDRFSRYDVDLIEEPLRQPNPTALAALTTHARKRNVKIAADESLRDLDTLEQYIDADAIDAVILKPMFLGGLLQTQRLAKRAREARLDIVITHALESAVGRAGAISIAAHIPGIHGLGDPGFENDQRLCAEGRKHELPVPKGPGHGTRPSASPIHVPSRSEQALPPIPNPLQSSSLARPEHLALVTAEQTWTYRQLATDAATIASSLRARGIEEGMTIALSGARNGRFVTVMHALGWLGAAVAPLAERMPLIEQERFIEALGVRMHVDASESFTPASPMVERPWPRTETRLVIGTSGSSGAPKAIALSTDQLILSAAASSFRLGHNMNDGWLCCLPLHHIGGMSILMRAALYGTTVHLHEHFDAARVSAALDDPAITMVSLVPQMLERVLDARRDRPLAPHVRVVLVGGGHCPRRLVERAAACGVPLALSWGMTETASQVATWVHDEDAQQLDESEHVGPPLCFARVEEENGRLRVNGPLSAGAFVTHDRGQVDEQGRIIVHGRADAIIISGGEKIAPSEVERTLCEHDDVTHAFVTGTDDPKWGQRPIALVQTTVESSVSDEDLIRWCRAHLTGFKVPRRIQLTTDMPTTELGKVARPRAAALLRRLVNENPSGPEASEEPRGSRSRNHLGVANESMHEEHASTHLPRRSHQVVAEGNASVAEALDVNADINRLPHAQRTLEIRLGMHQGKSTPLPLEQSVDTAIHPHQQLFESRMTKFEHPREEYDSRSIHLKESRSDSMRKGHDDDAR